MTNITLTLNDSQLTAIQTSNGISPNPEIDFTAWLQTSLNNRIIPTYRNYIKKEKIDMATQMIDFDIMDKMQEIIDVVKLDKNAEYTISAKPIVGEVLEFPIGLE